MPKGAPHSAPTSLAPASQDANLWDVSTASTIVMTQRGAKQHFQSKLRARGVEVVEYDFLTPEAVAEYCFERGFLQCLWECGGTLAAPAIAGGAIHKAMAFIAPKMVRVSRVPIKRGGRLGVWEGGREEAGGGGVGIGGTFGCFGDW
jgi:riboflavin biosynthesis pyrimidine reductase